MADELATKDVAEKANGVLPEAFFDLIGRVVPGLLALWLYFLEFLPKNTDAPTLAVGCLIFAYIIGFAIDITCDAILTGLSKSRKLSECVYINDSQHVEWIRLRGPYDRSVGLKVMAEKVMFRSCMVIFTIAIFVKPNLNLALKLHKWDDLGEVYFLVALIVSAIGYWRSIEYIKGWKAQLDKLRNESTNSR